LKNLQLPRFCAFGISSFRGIPVDLKHGPFLASQNVLDRRPRNTRLQPGRTKFRDTWKDVRRHRRNVKTLVLSARQNQLLRTIDFAQQAKTAFSSAKL
jgi:hypothetical protein